MIKCLELARKAVGGMKLKHEELVEIDRGFILSFTDSKTERSYRVMVTEITEEALDYDA